MSIVIKSNNVASVSFGTAKMLNTTAYAEFAKYKARVLDDGGVIKDEARTLDAISLLFDTKMYGNMNTAVSGTFGLKLNGAGGIERLYAIDGFDLIGVTYGTGTLPTVTADKNITFAANDAAQNVNGGMFTSSGKHIMSKAGAFGYSVIMRESGASTIARRLAGMTKHDDAPNAYMASGLSYISSNGDVRAHFQKNPLNLMAVNELAVKSTPIKSFNYPAISYLTMPEISKSVTNRAGVEFTPVDGQSFLEAATEDFYLDFGGSYHSDTKFFSDAVVRDFFCFNQATRAQATALSTFPAL